ncbi:MAG: DNA-binding protein [Opitutaceae bacterium]|nr:DNA-binding protein [Opitutaceae bacterium]
MPQLLVRNLEPAVVRKLRRQAAAAGLSMEEAHRRLLRKVLLEGEAGSAQDFLSYLRSIPGGDAGEFSRSADKPRRNLF